MHNDSRLFILSAASGTGKTSLARALAARFPDLAISVSHTTRQPRPGEQPGEHYYFVTPQEFEAMAARGEFLEHAEVFGNRYGTARRAVEALLAGGKRVLFDIDWQGARAIKRAQPDALGIFLLPPSRAALAQRLRDRRQDAPEVIERRMRAAIDEMRHYREFDYVVVNDTFEHALADLAAIVGGEPQARRPLALDVEALLRPAPGPCAARRARPGSRPRPAASRAGRTAAPAGAAVWKWPRPVSKMGVSALVPSPVRCAWVFVPLPSCSRSRPAARKGLLRHTVTEVLHGPYNRRRLPGERR